jgi:pimeloyl-ACP methyl ester carboxylesterase
VLAEVGVCTIRVDYRIPGHLSSCILDVAVAIDLAHRAGGSRFMVVGHSFGGAVAIGAAVNLPDLVVGVATLATQSAGCEQAALLGSRPLLLIHGDQDDIIPVGASETVRTFAGTGEVVVLPGSDHMLTTAAEDLRGRLPRWILRAFDGEAEPF